MGETRNEKVIMKEITIRMDVEFFFFMAILLFRVVAGC